MTKSRYDLLMADNSVPLTEDEIKAGWHFCWEWDSLLIGPGMGELHCCDCLDPIHKVYSTIPIEFGEAVDISDLF